MKKRILALLLVVTMVLSLAACGKKDGKEEKKEAPSMYSVLEKANDMKNGVYEIALDTNFNGVLANTEYAMLDKISIKVNGTLESETKMSMAIAYKYGTMSDYAVLTTMVLDNEDIYFNIKQLKEAAVQLGTALANPTISMAAAFLPEGEYLKINQKEIEEYSSSLGVEVPVETDAANVASQEVLQIALKHIVKLVENATKDITPALLSGTTDNVKMAITKENLSAAIEALEKVDFAAAYDEFIKEAEAVQGAESTVKELKNSKENVVKEVKEMLAEAKTSASTFEKFDFTLNTSVTGEAGKREVKEDVKFSVADATGAVDCTVSMNVKESIGDADKVVVPTDAVSFTDFMNSILSSFAE